jgi:hypothetical protein
MVGRIRIPVRSGLFAVVTAAAAAGAAALGGDEPPGPFAPSRLTTSTGEKLAEDWGYASEDCAGCHPVQHAEWKGSLHSRAHNDGLYLAFAKRARAEGGEAMYRFCSGCHAPAAVASGEIPGGKGRETTHHTDDGVGCVVCHSVASMKTLHAGGGADGSIVLGTGEVMYGPIADPSKTPAHGSEHSALHEKAEFCSNCHTLTHPANGLVIENTYEEWKKGPYAAAGIQCQDCHMRTVEQALRVAETMKPVKVPGRTTQDPEERPDVHAHLFVGANTNREATGAGEVHVAEAEKRLKTAASIAVEAPAKALAGKPFSVTIAVTNRAAGHAIPTSITELRQVWIDLRVTDAGGREVFRSGAIDGAGRVDPKAVVYHSVLADEKGEVTYLPWRAVKMIHEKLIPPKATVRETYEVTPGEGAKPPFQVAATLRYRSAPQDVLDALFGKGTLSVRAVDMTSAEATVAAE